MRTEHEIEIDKIHDRQLAERDAEIERLKAIITELADALVSQDKPPTRPYLREDHEFIQRARKAAK